MQQAQSRETSSTQFLFGTVMVGIILAVIIEVIVQLLPPHYNPISQSESGLTIGPYGFLIGIDFVLRARGW